MNYAFKTFLLTLSLSFTLAFSFEEDTTHALDKLFFPQEFVESIQNNQFYTDDIPNWLNYLGFWHLRSHEDMWKQLLQKVTEHHTNIRESKELEKCSKEDLVEYSLVCRKRLEKLYKDHIALLNTSKTDNRVMITLFVAFIFSSLVVKAVNRIANTTPLTLAALGAIYIIYSEWRTANKDMASILLEQLYELSESYLMGELKRHEEKPQLAL